MSYLLKTKLYKIITDNEDIDAIKTNIMAEPDVSEDVKGAILELILCR